VDYVTVPKPSGLGMVSSFKASGARMIIWVLPLIDARRIRRL
jgi:alpha-glucosidase (family GH31 glycosyl hydrolase)